MPVCEASSTELEWRKGLGEPTKLGGDSGFCYVSKVNLGFR